MNGLPKAIVPEITPQQQHFRILKFLFGLFILPRFRHTARSVLTTTCNEEKN
jgi:hypothetical protein